MRSVILLGGTSSFMTVIGFITWLTVPALGTTPLPVEERTTNPQLLSSVDPVYPPEAHDAELEAGVIMQAVIRKDGTVDGDAIRCLMCSVRRVGEGPEEVLRGWCPDFCEACIEAVAQWRYKPGTLDGEPVDVYFTIVIDFELQ